MFGAKEGISNSQGCSNGGNGGDISVLGKVPGPQSPLLDALRSIGKYALL
jgi:hypothetical protein